MTGKNPLLGRKWLVFLDTTPEQQAVATFLKRFGYPPDEVHRKYGLIYLGPVRETEDTEKEVTDDHGRN